MRFRPGRTMGAELKASVEELTGRRVVAFMGGNHLDPDMAVEVVILGAALSSQVRGARCRGGRWRVGLPSMLAWCRSGVGL